MTFNEVGYGRIIFIDQYMQYKVPTCRQNYLLCTDNPSGKLV